MLTNPQSLVDAEDLLKVGESLRQRGLMCEALDCYEMISKLCPGSRVEAMANEAKTRMFAVSLRRQARPSLRFPPWSKWPTWPPMAKD